MWAVGEFVPLTGKQGEANVTLAPFLAQALQGGSLADLFNAAFKIAIAIGAILAVVRLVYAGFIYMSTDVFGVKNDAKEKIWGAMSGLFLLLAIWIILRQINPQILQLNLL
jgi:undecaprenyl pyrophosphate phosphatase UppP